MYYYRTLTVKILRNWYGIRSGNEAKETVDIKETPELPYGTEVIAENLSVPWSLDITRDGRIFLTEREGNIRLIENGVLQDSPIYTFEPPFTAQGEGGLMGLVLDPDFENNGYFYVMYTYRDNGGEINGAIPNMPGNPESGNSSLYNRVVRMHYDREGTREDKVLLDRIPGGVAHNGGRLGIGPDGKLYATVGDGGVPELAQDRNSLAGKIVRMELDGSVPADNPFPDSYVYALGLRNSQGITWDENGILYASEHGNIAHDEINIIVPGGNYGWPSVQGDEEQKGNEYRKPLITSGNDTWAPSGIAYIKEGPLEGKLLAATLRGQDLLVMTLGDNGSQVLDVNSLFKDEFGRLRDIYEGEGGLLYLTTSNRDGRGLPAEGDDKVILLIPR